MLDLRDLEVPVICAPMAGGPSTASLAAAVTGAGGLGFLAGGYKTADQVAADVRAVRAATSGPYGLNLFVVEPFEFDQGILDDYRRSLEPDAARLGVELGDPHWDDDSFHSKLELVLDVRPDVVSFTFGCPSPDVLRRLAELDIHTTITVTSVAEAREAAARGAASLAVQGPEAGGHRGVWDQAMPPERMAFRDLVPAVVAAVDVPVAAGGGLADAAGVASAIGLGAVAAQVGTAYLLADEAGTNPVHRAALVDPTFEATHLTRAYTGRWARGLANRFMAEHTDTPAGFPYLHHLTAPLRAAALASGDPQVALLLAGTRHAEARPAPAAEITRSLGARS